MSEDDGDSFHSLFLVHKKPCDMQVWCIRTGDVTCEKRSWRHRYGRCLLTSRYYARRFGFLLPLVFSLGSPVSMATAWASMMYMILVIIFQFLETTPTSLPLGNELKTCFVQIKAYWLLLSVHLDLDVQYSEAALSSSWWTNGLRNQVSKEMEYAPLISTTSFSALSVGASARSPTWWR